MSRIILLTLIVSCLFSCKTKQYLPENYNGKIIKLGTGGGFTGQLIEYTLLENGQVFRSSNGGRSELTRLERNKAQQMFDNIYSMQFHHILLDDPGNMYHYLEIIDMKETHKIQWGANDANVPRELLIYFANAKKILSSQKQKNEKI